MVNFPDVEPIIVFFFFSSRRRHTRFDCDWSSDVCSSDLVAQGYGPPSHRLGATRRAGSRDGVRRLRAILARLERRAQDGVREVRRLAAAAGGWQLADGPGLRIRGLGPGEPVARLIPAAPYESSCI